MISTAIGPFAGLLVPQTGDWPPQTQARARAEFASTLHESPLHLGLPHQTVEANVPRRLVIGVASYSIHDLKMLDRVAELVSRETREQPVRVEVFDVASCQTSHDFEALIPGIGDVLRTPVAGYWRNGELTDREIGYEARELIARVFGLSNWEDHPPERISSP